MDNDQIDAIRFLAKTLLPEYQQMLTNYEINKHLSALMQKLDTLQDQETKNLSAIQTSLRDITDLTNIGKDKTEQELDELKKLTKEFPKLAELNKNILEKINKLSNKEPDIAISGKTLPINSQIDQDIVANYVRDTANQFKSHNELLRKALKTLIDQIVIAEELLFKKSIDDSIPTEVRNHLAKILKTHRGLLKNANLVLLIPEMELYDENQMTANHVIDKIENEKYFVKNIEKIGYQFPIDGFESKPIVNIGPTK